MLYSRKICGASSGTGESCVGDLNSYHGPLLERSSVGAASGIFDAVLKHFLSSVVPEYVPSTFLVLAINAPTISRRVASPILQIK